MDMQGEIVQASMFDYGVFDEDTSTFLQETADKIKGRTRRCAAENGKDLLATNDPTTEYPIQEPGRREHNGD
jgi:hypothetical protein